MTDGQLPEPRMTDGQWNKLISEIKKGNCTPFLGAGACYGVFPLGKEIANTWAKECEHPLTREHDDLAKVAQYYALHIGIDDHPRQLLRNGNSSVPSSILTKTAIVWTARS